jgi:hypothetical protein
MNTIIGKGYGGNRDEKEAAGTITPGMLVKRTSADKVIAHNVAGGPVNALFAIEDENQGRGIDDNYVSGELVKLWKPIPGDQVNAIVDDTTGRAIAIGDYVESAGDGRVRKVDPPLSSAGKDEFPASILGVALEAVAPSAAGTRILIEIM